VLLVAGTDVAGSPDTGLTITSVGSANFADFWGDVGGVNNLSSITFAHSVLGDTAFTGVQAVTSALQETINASAFTGALTLGGVATATAESAPPAAGVVATLFGDGGSGFGDTVLLGSGTTYFAEHIVANGSVGDNFTLLAGHTAIDTLDSTATSKALFLATVTYSSAGNDAQAGTTVTGFNLGSGLAGSGDVLKMSWAGGVADAVGTFADIGTGGLVNGHQYSNVGTGTGIVTGTSVTTGAAFEADVAAAATTSTDGHVIAAVFGGNTYIAEIEFNGAAGEVQFVTLVGVAATSVSLSGGTTGSIHIA
jgi:hypothetical protein